MENSENIKETDKESWLNFVKELVLNPECQKHGKIKETYLLKTFGTTDIIKVNYDSNSDGYVISE